MRESQSTGKWLDPTVPKRGWETLEVHDLEKPDKICEMCEEQEIRFVHVMEHIDYGILECGCVCAGHMCDDLDGARKRDNDAKLKSRRLDRREEKLDTQAAQLDALQKTLTARQTELSQQEYEVAKLKAEVRQLRDENAALKRQVAPPSKAANPFIRAAENAFHAPAQTVTRPVHRAEGTAWKHTQNGNHYRQYTPRHKVWVKREGARYIASEMYGSVSTKHVLPVSSLQAGADWVDTRVACKGLLAEVVG